MTSPDERIEQRARALYREASRRLDPATAGRLRAARREALQPSRHAHRVTRVLLPVGAFAVLALAALMVWQPHRGAPESTAPVAAVATAPGAASDDGDLPPDADSADPSLYQNLDFYGWLAANDTAAPARH